MPGPCAYALGDTAEILRFKVRGIPEREEQSGAVRKVLPGFDEGGLPAVHKPGKPYDLRSGDVGKIPPDLGLFTLIRDLVLGCNEYKRQRFEKSAKHTCA